MTTLNLQVGASTDNCWRRLTPAYWELASNNIQAGADAAPNYQYGAGMRFADVTIPKGATIIAAYLTLTCGYATAATVANTKISAEGIDNAPTFADDAAVFDTRFGNHTTARPVWNAIPAWTVDTEYQSPEIKTVIQEIVNRAGWVSGNAIAIFWEDYDDDSTHVALARRICYAYDGDSDKAPKLHIEYTIPTPTVQTNDADGITHEQAKLHGKLTDDGGEACEVRFQWGETTAYGNDTAWQPGKATNDLFEQLITGLDSDKTYHFRAQAKNAHGTSSGADKEFTTQEVPPPPAKYRKIIITHPALKTVRVIKDGEEQTKYENLSNLEEGFIHGEIELPAEAPTTVEVTTLAEQVYKFNVN